MENDNLFQKEVLNGLCDLATGAPETGSPLFNGTSPPRSFHVPADTVNAPFTLEMDSQAILFGTEIGKLWPMNPDTRFPESSLPIISPSTHPVGNGANTTSLAPVDHNIASASYAAQGNDPPMTYSDSPNLVPSATSLMLAQSKESHNQMTSNWHGNNMLFSRSHSEGRLPTYQPLDMFRQIPGPAANNTACNIQTAAVAGHPRSMYYPGIKNGEPSGNASGFHTPNANQAVRLAPRNSTPTATDGYAAGNYPSLNSDVYSQNMSFQSSLASANAIRPFHQRPRQRNGREVSLLQLSPPDPSFEMEMRNKKAELRTKVLESCTYGSASDELMTTSINEEIEEYTEWCFDKINDILKRNNTSANPTNARKNIELKLARQKHKVRKEVINDFVDFICPAYRRVVAENMKLRAELRKRDGALNGSSAPPDDPSSGGPPNDFGQQGPPPSGPGFGPPNSFGGPSFPSGPPSNGQPPSDHIPNAQLSRGASDGRPAYSLLENLSDEESNVDGKAKTAPATKAKMCSARKTNKDVRKCTGTPAGPSKSKSRPKHKSNPRPGTGKPCSTTAEHSGNSLNALKHAKRGNVNYLSTPVNRLILPRSQAAARKVKVLSLSCDFHMPKLRLPASYTDVSEWTQVRGKNYNRRARNRLRKRLQQEANPLG